MLPRHTTQSLYIRNESFGAGGGSYVTFSGHDTRMAGMPASPIRWDGSAMSQQGDEYRRLSFWHDTVPGSLEPGPSLDGDTEADVAIAGAGLTGMWTAYYLSATNPGLRIVLCEREIAGFGASGRNGGWCSALFPASLPKLERMAGRESAIAMYRAMQQTVDEVGKVAADEGIDCHWAKGGTVQFARSAAQMERASDEVHEARLYGFDEADMRLLSASEAQEISGMSDVLGAVFTPHCAAIHPAGLRAASPRCFAPGACASTRRPRFSGSSPDNW